jgi:hypothetical protein
MVRSSMRPRVRSVEYRGVGIGAFMTISARIQAAWGVAYDLEWRAGKRRSLTLISAASANESTVHGGPLACRQVSRAAGLAE